MRRSGFTVVEIMVVLFVLGVLLSIAFLGVNMSQAKARDEKRRSDVEIISQKLESFYNTGTGVEFEELGRYPDTTKIANLGSIQSIFYNLDVTVLYAPGEDANGGVSLKPGGLGDLSPAHNEYLYQPMAWNGSSWVLCDSGALECRRYNLFYKSESTGETHKIESRNR